MLAGTTTRLNEPSLLTELVTLVQLVVPMTGFCSSAKPVEGEGHETMAVFVMVSCLGVSNRIYQLQGCSSLSNATLWIPAGPPQVATNGVVNFIDPGGASNSTRYYRVQAQ